MADAGGHQRPGRFWNPDRPRPSELVEAAMGEYLQAKPQYEGLLARVEALLADGATDFDAVAEVWMGFRIQQQLPFALLIAAVCVVERAKTTNAARLQSPPAPPLT